MSKHILQMMSLRMIRCGGINRQWPLACAMLVACQAAGAVDFTVQSPGYYYSINGSAANPTLTLVRGKTYTFQISASSIHPFYIESPGVQNNNISSGTITYT